MPHFLFDINFNIFTHVIFSLPFFQLQVKRKKEKSKMDKKFFYIFLFVYCFPFLLIKLARSSLLFYSQNYFFHKLVGANIKTLV